MLSFLLSLSLSLSLLVSPEVQVVLGNSMGVNGWLLYPILILLGVVVYFTMQTMMEDGEGGGLGRSPSWLVQLLFLAVVLSLL